MQQNNVVSGQWPFFNQPQRLSSPNVQNNVTANPAEVLMQTMMQSFCQQFMGNMTSGNVNIPSMQMNTANTQNSNNQIQNVSNMNQIDNTPSITQNNIPVNNNSSNLVQANGINFGQRFNNANLDNKMGRNSDISSTILNQNQVNFQDLSNMNNMRYFSSNASNSGNIGNRNSVNSNNMPLLNTPVNVSHLTHTNSMMLMNNEVGGARNMEFGCVGNAINCAPIQPSTTMDNSEKNVTKMITDVLQYINVCVANNASKEQKLKSAETVFVRQLLSFLVRQMVNNNIIEDGQIVQQFIKFIDGLMEESAMLNNEEKMKQLSPKELALQANSSSATRDYSFTKNKTPTSSLKGFAQKADGVSLMAFKRNKDVDASKKLTEKKNEKNTYETEDDDNDGDDDGDNNDDEDFNEDDEDIIVSESNDDDDEFLTSKLKKTKKEGSEMRWPCGICGSNVVGSSIMCISCNKWIHKRCSGITGKLHEVKNDFICLGCRKDDENEKSLSSVSQVHSNVKPSKPKLGPASFKAKFNKLTNMSGLLLNMDAGSNSSDTDFSSANANKPSKLKKVGNPVFNSASAADNTSAKRGPKSKNTLEGDKLVQQPQVSSKKEKSTDCDSALIPLLCVHG